MAQRDEFRNVGKGWCHVITIDRRGEQRGIAVAQGDRILLTEEEQIATANAPRDPDNNPFIHGGDNGLVLERVRTDVSRTNHRPLGPEDAPSAPAGETEQPPSEPEPEAESPSKEERGESPPEKPAEKPPASDPKPPAPAAPKTSPPRQPQTQPAAPKAPAAAQGSGSATTGSAKSEKPPATATTT